ncbi:tyrosine-type recombinase/integrase, partial [Hominisplanchenecus faecis]
LQIKKTDVQTGYNALKGHADLQRRYYQTVNQIMRAAIDDGLLFKNVAENIEKDPAPKKKKRALTELERIHLEDLELDPQASTLLHMLLYTGMRRQEIIPLTRFDINFARKKITVNKAVKFVGETAVLKDTKTDSGEREIYLLDPLADVLKKYLSTLQGNLLFPGTDGSYLKKSQYR